MRDLLIALSTIVMSLLGQACSETGDAPVPPTPTPVPEREALVVGTDFVTGSFAIIQLDPPRAVTPASAQRMVDSDAVARVFDDRVYIVNRLTGESVQVLDPAADYATESDCSTGTGSNPHDIAFVDQHKAYVTLYGGTQLLIVNPAVGSDCNGFVVGHIDLAQFADADGIPEMDLMAVVGDRLYVSLELLDRNMFFAPTGPGAVVVIDTTSDEVLGEITLAASNPFGTTKGLTVRGTEVLVSLTGEFNQADGGVQRIDTTTDTAGPFVVTEATLGGDLTDFVIVSDTIGYAVISKPDFTNALVEFDPSAGTFTRTLLGDSSIADIELNDRNELFISERSTGVRIFRASDGTELTAEAIPIGLPPGEIVFVP